MAKIVAYNPYLYIMGGGEFYFISALQKLTQHHDVTIVIPDEISPHDLWRNAIKTFGIKELRASLKTDKRIGKDKFDLCIAFNNTTICHHYNCQQINVIQAPVRYKIAEPVECIVFNSKYTSFHCSHMLTAAHKQVITPPVKHPPHIAMHQKKNILAVGRIGESLHSKNELALLQAAREVLNNPKNSDATFSLVGKTILASQNYIAELLSYANKRIKIYLDVSRIHLEKLYEKSNIFWSGTGYGSDLNHQPMRAEHYGIAIAEAALYSAIPLVQPRGGYFDFLERDKTCKVWKTLEELVSQTNYLLDNYSECSQLQANLRDGEWRKKVLSPSAFSEEWFRLVQRMLS